MKKYFIIGLLAITLVLPACVKAQTTATAMEDVMAALRQQMSNLLQQIDKMQEELGKLRGEVVKVEEQIEKLTKRLQVGSNDKEVKTLQEFLKQDPEVYPEGLVTGYYGALTEKAVKKFQEKNGIEAIGVVGPKTLAKINEVIEEKKITICHIPPENLEKKQTITISKSALEAHMAHGDKMGACEGEIIPTPTQKPIPTTPVCIQVTAPAKDPATGNCKIFPTPCDVPSNWIKVDNCSISSTSFINVLSPNGGEVWAKGSTQILQWKSSSDINTVYIKLRKGSDTYPGSEGMINGMIFNAGTNLGSHQWTIPTTLPDGNDYYIRIIDKTGAVLDDSDAPFSIVTMMSQNQAPKITGGSVPPSLIQIGQTVNFSWNAEDSNKDNLVWSVNWGDGESMLGACPSSNPSNGQGWTLNTFHKWQQAGTYIVKTAVSDCKGGTYSQSLTVNVSTTVAPYITVLSPNGGETWYMGKTYDILWKSSGVEKVYIAAKVFKDDVHVGSLGIASSADNVWGALGKYSWTPNSNHLREGNQIKIEISNTEIPASGVSTPETLPSDESDDYFKIQ